MAWFGRARILVRAAACGRACPGRFLYVGDEKLWVRGVTYGTFLPSAPDDDGYDPARLRTATSRRWRLPVSTPFASTRCRRRWLLDTALSHGLWVAVDIPWEEHITFLDQRGLARQIRERVGPPCAACAGHPAILAFSIGNEIPSRIVRWHGAAAVEDFLESLADAVREADPGALVTYVNYPSTEYLRVRGIDYDSWNVYLEDNEDFERYVARLQNLSPERPVGHRRAGCGQPAQGRRLPGPAHRHARCEPPSRPAARARSCSPGRTSGPAAAWPSTTGTSA